MKQTELTGTCRVCCRDMTQKETEAPARPVCPESEVILPVFLLRPGAQLCTSGSLSENQARQQNSFSGSQRLREVDFFSLLQRHSPSHIRHSVLCRKAGGILQKRTLIPPPEGGNRISGSGQPALFLQRLPGDLLRSHESGISRGKSASGRGADSR